jgi:hypothetical protein
MGLHHDTTKFFAGTGKAKKKACGNLPQALKRQEVGVLEEDLQGHLNLPR